MDVDDPEEERDEQQTTVFVALRGGVRSFTYEYDLGDSWVHQVVVERTASSPLSLKHAVCLDGQYACPPEDVGGVPGYELFLKALADPAHEEHDSYLDWVGYPFDPAAFDLAAANAALQRVR